MKKAFLYLLIFSVATSAAIGILVLTMGQFGETELKILATTMTITALSILGLTCGAAYESGYFPALTLSGIGVSAVAATIWILLIWSDSTQGEYPVKVALSLTLVAFVLSYTSLISFARLDSRFVWARIFAIGIGTTLVMYLLYIIWLNNSPDEDFAGRTIGSLSILLAAITISLPVFHKLSSERRGLVEIDAEIAEMESRLETLRAERSELLGNSGD